MYIFENFIGCDSDGGSSVNDHADEDSGSNGFIFERIRWYGFF